ncbi:MAG: fibronectin type III domain-containing protein [Tepidisphaeraceae bacterium]
MAAQLIGSVDNIDAKNPTQVGLFGSGRVNAAKAVGPIIAPPRIFAVNGLPAEGASGTVPATFSVDLRNVFAASSVVGSNFTLDWAGADNVFGTVDDASIPISLSNTSYRIGTNRLNFVVTGAATLPNGLYRFKAKSGSTGLVDPFNQQLDGNADGTAGDDFVRSFAIGDVAVPVAPPAPTALAAAISGTTGATLTWLDNALNETGFIVQRATDANFTQNLVSTNYAANTVTASVTGLAPATGYYFRVQAVNTVGPSAFSNTATITTPVPVGELAAPSSVTATAQAFQQVSLSWIDNATSETKFTIQRATDAGFTQNVGSREASANATSFWDWNLNKGTLYYYRIRAETATAQGPWSGVVTVTTQGTPAAAGAAPTNLAVAPQSAGQVSLAWDDNSSDETAFTIERSLSSTFATIDATRSASVNTSSFWDWNLLDGTTYFYRIRAETPAGPSAYSNVASVTTTGTATLPTAPSATAATLLGSNGARVTWTDNSTNETGFEVQRATDAAFSANLVTTTVTANLATLDITGLTAGATYYFRVRAVNAAGNSAYAATASLAVPTAPTAPAAPSGLTATGVVGGVNLVWVDNANNETGFEVQTATDAAFSANLVTTTAAANATSLSITGLAAGTTYHFRVRAVNAVGPSAYSASASAAVPVAPTAPAAPSGLAATAVTGGVNLTWVDNSTDETGFEVQRATDAAFSANLVTTTAAANATGLSITSLTAGTTYYFRVRAVNAVGPSAYTAIASATVPVPAVPTIGNSGFEAPTTSTYIYNPTGSTWAFNAYAGIQRNGSAWSAATAPEGVQTAFIQGSSSGLGSITQSLTFAAGTYVLSFRAAQRTGYSVQPLKFTVDGVQIGTLISPTATSFGTYTTGSFTVPAGTHVVAFTATNGTSDRTTFVDAVSIATATASAPAAPTALTATLLGTTGARLAWTSNSNNETGFEVQQATDAAFTTGVVATTVLAAVATLDVTSLTAGTTYYFRVRAINGAGNSTYTSTASLVIPSVPATPTGFTATPVVGGVSLAWVDSSTNETGFEVQRATNSTFTTGLVTTTAAANATSLSVTSLTAGTTYYFRVRAVNAIGSSAYTAAVSATVPTAPTAPTGLTATPVSGGVNLVWVDTSTNETGFEVQRATNSAFTAGLVTTTAAAGASSLSVTGLAANTTYYFRLRAVNAVGPSAYTATASATVPNPNTPAAPSGLTLGMLDTGAVRVAWADNSTNETGFEIQRATNSSFTSGLVTLTTAANATTLDVTSGMNTNTTYYFRVRAVNGTVSSAYSSTGSITYPLVQTPTAPASLTATLLTGGTSVRLAWADRSTNETGFEVQRATNNSFSSGLVTTTVAANTSTADLTGLAGGTTYYFRVRAVNYAASSAYTASATATTSSTLGAPTGFTATRTASGTIKLTWTDNSSAETQYEIEGALDSAFIFSASATVNTGTTTYTATGLSGGTRYYFRIRAINASSKGSWSSVISAVA